MERNHGIPEADGSGAAPETSLSAVSAEPDGSSMDTEALQGEIRDLLCDVIYDLAPAIRLNMFLTVFDTLKYLLLVDPEPASMKAVCVWATEQHGGNPKRHQRRLVAYLHAAARNGAPRYERYGLSGFARTPQFYRALRRAVYEDLSPEVRRCLDGSVGKR